LFPSLPVPVPVLVQPLQHGVRGVRGAREENDGTGGDFAGRMENVENVNENEGEYRSVSELFGRQLQKEKWNLINDKVGYLRFVLLCFALFCFVLLKTQCQCFCFVKSNSRLS
jgi:hypothetical protein